MEKFFAQKGLLKLRFLAIIESRVWLTEFSIKTFERFGSTYGRCGAGIFRKSKLLQENGLKFSIPFQNLIGSWYLQLTREIHGVWPINVSRLKPLVPGHALRANAWSAGSLLSATGIWKQSTWWIFPRALLPVPIVRRAPCWSFKHKAHRDYALMYSFDVIYWQLTSWKPQSTFGSEDTINV